MDIIHLFIIKLVIYLVSYDARDPIIGRYYVKARKRLETARIREDIGDMKN